MTIKSTATILQPELKNVFKLNDPSQNTQSTFPGYIQTKSVFRLKNKPISYKVLLHAYGANSLFEHEIVYLTYGGHFRSKRFSDFANIAIKTEQIASSYVVVYVRGTAKNEPLALTQELQKQLGISSKNSEVEILN